MKTCCKNVDITDRELISRAVRDCLKDKLDRKDTIELFAEYCHLQFSVISGLVKEDKRLLNPIIEMVIDGIRQEIIDKNYVVKPIVYKTKIDGCSGKLRCIGIQDVKQQLYDYIAVYALEELFRKKIGFYQCSALENKGKIMGMKSIEKWIRNKNIRYAYQTDIRQYYQSIPKDKMKALLRRDVANKAILHLVFFLIDTFEHGLSIGSYLSQYLANYYLSYAYHFVSEQCYRIRKKKDGTTKRVNLADYVLCFMDDFISLGTNKKDIKKAKLEYEKYCRDMLGLEVKDTARFIDLKTDYIDMMGFKISRKSTTMRASNFRRFRRNVDKVYKLIKTNKPIPFKLAKSTASRWGSMKYSNGEKFKRQHHVDLVLKECNKVISMHDRRKSA